MTVHVIVCEEPAGFLSVSGVQSRRDALDGVAWNHVFSTWSAPSLASGSSVGSLAFSQSVAP